MTTFYTVVCIMLGAFGSLFLSNMTVHPWISEDRTPTSMVVSVLCMAILIAAGIALWLLWGYNVIGYVVGVLMVFLPYFRTAADRSEEQQTSDSR
ncbi:MAG: hypothetical protein ACI32N_02200 [Bulleidia sp.]